MIEQHKTLVSKLATAHHAGAAYRALLGCGLDALPAVREGLRHESADVRHHCCQFLDHFLVPEVMDDLVAILDDPDERVRRSALHTLGCDRCKQGSCRPDEAKVLPCAVTLLASDPDPHVRAHAVGLVGRWVRRGRSPPVDAVGPQSRGPQEGRLVRSRWANPSANRSEGSLGVGKETNLGYHSTHFLKATYPAPSFGLLAAGCEAAASWL